MPGLWLGRLRQLTFVRNMDQTITITHDGTLDIATGRSRKEVSWHNKEVQWSALVKKISVPHRTAETHAEYMSMKKALQDERKDVGGFVGGYLTGGRRKTANVLHRQLVTLDIDFAKGDLWGDYTMLYCNAALLYSTHKHTGESPRLRLVIPLDRPVSREEYVAIARRMAGDLGINAFDDTTYEPARLMYWPSVSKDGEYVFEYQDGPWLSADAVLGSYKNWRDASEWPVSDRAGEVIRREIKKQGDPLEKPGIVGAFCRTYDIHEAMAAFLGDIYEPCDVENRYTYKAGSTAAGLVTYDDRYAYSHHGTDPVSGKLCNAFDLVRLHLFGLRDDEAKEGCPVNKLPSYTAMSQLAAEDSAVRKRLAEERAAAVRSDFAEAYEAAGAGDEENTEWENDLEIDRNGKVLATANNYLRILKGHPLLRNLTYNEFKNAKEVTGPLLWRTDGGPWLDSDNSDAFIAIERMYGMSNASNLKHALKSIFRTNSYHPVRDYLNGLSWDGTPRLETYFIDYLGAEDSPYTRAVTRKSIVAAVARVFVPGIKWDYVPILVGKQGVGKSVSLQKLGRMDRGWFSDNFRLVGGKEDIEQLFGNWIIEMGELVGLNKKDVNEIKSYISRREDQCRLAYSEEKGYFPRQCVFFGTTNNIDFLKDTTGNRRFWPLPVGVLEPTKNLFGEITEEIDQIWAEAVVLFKRGERLYLDKDEREMAEEMQKEHTVADERTGLVEEYLNILLPEDWGERRMPDKLNFLDDPVGGTVPRDRVCVAEIWCECFRRSRSDLSYRDSAWLREIMRSIGGWEEQKNPTGFKGFGRQRAFKRIRQ